MPRVSSRKKTSSRPAAKGAGQIRIISGQWRGRKLKVLDSEGLRPTGDRVKEMLFNWLQMHLHQSHCLDLFAGSGGLSFEALSRFAESVTLVEKDQRVAEQLKKNLQLLDLPAEKAQLLQQDAFALLSNSAKQAYDIVFIDPPFGQDMVLRCCQLLEQNQWLAPEALVYIEQERGAAALQLPANWQLQKQKDTGQVTSLLYQFQSE